MTDQVTYAASDLTTFGESGDEGESDGRLSDLFHAIVIGERRDSTEDVMPEQNCCAFNFFRRIDRVGRVSATEDPNPQRHDSIQIRSTSLMERPAAKEDEGAQPDSGAWFRSIRCSALTHESSLHCGWHIRACCTTNCNYREPQRTRPFQTPTKCCNF